MLLSLGGISLSNLQSREPEFLKIKILPLKSEYLLGEPVTLSVEILNSSNDKIKVPINILSSSDVQISEDDITYYNYYGRNGIQLEVIPEIDLLPSQSIQHQFNILWNSKPEVGHLNSEVAERVSKGRILTDFAFTKPGLYFVRILVNSIKHNKNQIVSEPVKIMIKMPQEQDLLVWNKIKDNGNMAYLLQEGDFLIPRYRTEERKKLIEQVEDLIETYPSSFYASRLSQKLGELKSYDFQRQSQLCEYNSLLEHCKP